MKQSRLPDHLRRKGYRSPNWRAVRAETARAKMERHLMRGNVPEAIEQDREFFLLFQQWKGEGSPKEGLTYERMCARFMVVMETEEGARLLNKSLMRNYDGGLGATDAS